METNGLVEFKVNSHTVARVGEGAGANNIIGKWCVHRGHTETK
jgi:hypothetical protein